MRRHPLINQLAAEREALGLSQHAAAALAGLSPSTLSVMETGARMSTIETVDMVARQYGMTLTLVPTGDREPCRVCKELKPAREFATDMRRASRRATYCLACKAEGVAVAGQRGDQRTGRGLTNQSRTAARLQRLSTYAEHRDGGMKPEAAAEAVGLTTPRSRQRYERTYQTRTEAAA